MGSGIAQVCAQAGYPTVVREVSEDLVRKGIGGIDRFLTKGVEKGKIAQEEKLAVLSRLSGTTSLEDLRECDLIIEAVVENLQVKREMFAALDRLCRPEAIFASNTSSLCVTEIMTATSRPARFVGLHFFNPVPLMKLVEVVRTIATDAAVVETIAQFAHSLGKTPVQAKDTSGFIVNRLLVPYILDAIRALEEGVGSIQDIDTGMKLGCGHPMG
ncbi:MAG: 3-hydroxyacyl-CoA dehydrogenase family protein, partial [Thermoplasmata archaeon]